jgi:hypothetical protein
MAGKQIVRSYTGSDRSVRREFERDANLLAERGSMVVAQSSHRGQRPVYTRGCLTFWLASPRTVLTVIPIRFDGHVKSGH